jgi:tetratricopeptide (TPR) repeat protein
LETAKPFDPGSWSGRIAGRYERPVELVGGPTATRVVARFDADSLPPGDFRLELTPAGADTAAITVPVRLADPEEGAEGPGGGVVWTDLVRAPGDPGPNAPRLLITPSTPAWQLEKAYLDGLSHLAESQEDEAILAVMAAESSTLASGDAEAQEELFIAQLQIAGDLARIDVDSLLPLIAFHQRLYLEYADRRAFGLAARARRIATRLALAYADLRKRGEGNRIAARALESVAGHVLDAGGRIEAARLFRSAIELDPQGEASLHGLGRLLEASRDYRQARRYFERVLEIAPQRREVSLHLAVNFARGEREEDAERLYRACLDEDDLEWVGVIAHEELARLLDALGRRTEAIELLQTAVGRFSDAGLVIQLSAMLDSEGRRAEANELLEELERRTTDAGPSPRNIYGKMEFSAVRQSQREFSAIADGRLLQLRTAYLKLRGVIRSR